MALGVGLAAVAHVRGASANGAAPPVSHKIAAAPATWPLRPPPANATPVFAYDGALPGPVIFARQGEDIALDLTNRLAASTSLHIAGMRLPNALDGVPGLTGKAVAAGDSDALRFRARDCGFFTFGPADPALAAEQAGRGLGGVLIIADPKDPEVEADIVLLLKDWKLDPSGALEDSFADRATRLGQGRLGNVFTIGGLGERRMIALAPGTRFRVRLANACNARLLPLKFEGLRPTLIGVSGQQSAAFTPLHGEMLLVPGGRFDVVCDVPTDARPPAEPQIRAQLGNGFPLLGIVLAGDPVKPAATLGWLSDNGLPEFIDLRNAKRVDCLIARTVEPSDAAAVLAANPATLWAINGRSGDFSDPPLFSVKRGSSVVIAATNKSDVPIVVKLNGHLARLLHPRDDGWVPYWVDVVLVAPNTTERIAFVADNPGRWLFGGRILEHLAGGQFGWFEVA
jgi:FtsP/CotA-like multicopper oxidase with cupredoxin domain